jgi:hypothetical protein
MAGTITIRDIVKTQKRCVKHITLSNYEFDTPLDDVIALAYRIGITGSSFDAIGGANGLPFISGITAGSPKISRVRWSWQNNTSSPSMALIFHDGQGSESEDRLLHPPNETAYSYQNAIVLNGTDGDFSFESFSIKNSATTPTGFLYLSDSRYDGFIPVGTVTGTMTVEFVL